MNIDEQLNIIGKRLYGRMEKLELTPRIVQQRSGLALNSVKTAMTGKKCNVGTLAKICEAMAWTLFDLFEQPGNEGVSTQVNAELIESPTPAPKAPQKTSEASSII